MPDAPPKPDSDKLPEAEAEARFNRMIGNLVNTPHQPHAPLSQPKKEGGKRSKRD